MTVTVEEDIDCSSIMGELETPLYVSRWVPHYTERAKEDYNKHLAKDNISTNPRIVPATP